MLLVTTVLLVTAKLREEVGLWWRALLFHSQRQLWPAAGSADHTDTHDVRSPRRPWRPQRGAPAEEWCAVMCLTRPPRGGVKLPAVEIEGTVR